MLLYNWIGSLMTYFAIFIFLTIFFYFLLVVIEWVFNRERCECGERLHFSEYKSKGKIKVCVNPECKRSEYFSNKKVRVGK